MKVILKFDSNFDSELMHLYFKEWLLLLKTRKEVNLVKLTKRLMLTEVEHNMVLRMLCLSQM